MSCLNSQFRRQVNLRFGNSLCAYLRLQILLKEFAQSLIDCVGRCQNKFYLQRIWLIICVHDLHLLSKQNDPFNFLCEPFFIGFPSIFLYSSCHQPEKMGAYSNFVRMSQFCENIGCNMRIKFASSGDGRYYVEIWTRNRINTFDAI